MAKVEHVGAPCRRCGENHTYWVCPHTAALEFDGDGKLIRIEFVNVLRFAREAGDDEAASPYPKLKSVPS